MKKSKFFVIASLILILALTLVFCACNPDNTDNPDNPTTDGGSGDSSVEPTPDTGEGVNCTITYTPSEGIIYSSSNPTTVKKGESLTIKFTVDVFYTGVPTVQINNGSAKDAQYDEDTDTYSYKATIAKEQTVVTVGGVTKAVSSLLSTGTGESDSPFLVKEPIDLIKMAEVINSGADDSVMSVLGYYVLENDIDLKGQELQIIGDGNNDYAFFGGYFNGNGHTISNFKINSNGHDYVGLFGVVQQYYYDELGFTGGMIYNLKLSDYTITAVNTGSTLTCGSFVGQGFGANLVLCEAKNGNIDVMGDTNYFSYAGGIIGFQRAYMYPYYAKIVYCSTDNVTIGCSSGTTYAAGGVAGYVYADDDTAVSTITNCYTAGSITSAFHAGGIVGWLSNYNSVVACYSTCTIHAQAHISDTATMEEYCHAYAGGLVGMAQLDTIVADSFAVGEISAYAAAGSAYAHTGDIVGRVENLEDGLYSAKDMSVVNCYYVKGGKNDTIDLTKADTIKNKLGWHELDWVIADGSYPVVNLENSTTDDDTTITHYSYTVTLNFGGRTDKDGKTEFSTEFTDQYESMSYWYQVYAYSDDDDLQGIPEIIYSTNGYVSYGYFFDAELTKPIPCGFVPMRDVTLYVGFANNEDVAGTYYVIPNADYEESNNAVVELVLKVDGTYVCTDVYGSVTGTYVYNGDYVVFNDAKFARYFGESSIEKYQSYEFKGVITATGFDLYGALYSDEDLNEVVELVPRETPLKVVKKTVAIVGSYYFVDGEDTTIFEFFANGNGNVYENGVATEFTYVVDGQNVTLDVAREELNGILANGKVTSIDSISLTATDAYRGKWELSSLPNKYLEFDGAGNWEYSYYGFEKLGDELYPKLIDSTSGTYTLTDGKLVLSCDDAESFNGAVVSFENGFVKVTNTGVSYVYAGENGYYGLWTTADGKTLIELKGLSSDGYGVAKIRFITEYKGRERNEIYELTYAPDMLTEGNINFFYEGEYYGYAVYSDNSGVMFCSVYSLSESDFVLLNLMRVDEYKGEWVSGNDTFSSVVFNGYGIYTAFKDIALNGTISFNGTTVNYQLDEFSLTGIFSYDGKAYEISLDEGRNLVTVKAVGVDVELSRKDEFGGKTFLDADGNVYVFDGKGYLSSKGTMTVNGTTTYAYEIESEGKAILYVDGTYAGVVSADGAEGSRNYVFKYDDTQIVLGEKTAFTGTWALEASFGDLVEIGTMNYDKVLVGKVPLTLNGKTAIYDATFTLVDDEYLVWNVQEGLNLYVIKLADGVFVMSQHLNWFNYTNDTDNGEWYYSYLMTADLLTGTWTNGYEAAKFVFDGMGNNVEKLGMYTIANMYATSEDGDPEVRYYGYFERKDGTGSDFLVFTQYSTASKSAQRVVFKETVSADKYADEYKNADGDKAFVLETINLEDYELVRG